MKAHIGLTDDLADVFVIQALKEGCCDYLGFTTQEERSKYADYMIRKNRFDQKTYREGFDRLSQLMIMYDEIELPILNPYYELHEKLEKIAKIRKDLPDWFYSGEQLERDYLSDHDAMKIKPIVMSAIKNINFTGGYIQYAVERKGSINKLYSTVYDMMYNHKSEVFDELLYMEASMGYSMLSENQQPNLPEQYILYTYKVIITLVKNFIIYLEMNKSGKYDYYSRVFTNFGTAINVNDAYGMIKTQISYILEQQPAFESISEIINFKKKKKKAIHDLREEISSLEELFREGACEDALQKAINDVRLANTALLKNSPVKRIAQIATYISVPISVLELVVFGTSFSTLIGVAGTIAQFETDKNSKQRDWLFVAK